MEPRSLGRSIEEICFSSHKIALVSGPRQVGKTTLAKELLDVRGTGSYHNWDDVRFRRTWAKDPAGLVQAALAAGSAGRTPLVVLDEIHKARGWKRTLKGLYDTRPAPVDVIVTGSARLNVYKRGGDSLLGRAYHFRMHPFSVAELARPHLPTEPDLRLAALFEHSLGAGEPDRFERLMKLGGFPEPLLRGSDKTARLWRASRVEKVIREDLRDLSRVPELGRVEMLAALLPERVASPLSRSGLSQDLEVSFGTVDRWVALLKELYYAFEIRPWTSRVARSLKKEGKIYLWDWSEVDAPGPRFENLVASHLLKACDSWTDSGEGTFELRTLRNKEKQELDFLVTRDRKPWLPVEAKLSDEEPAPHWAKFLGYLGLSRGLQLVAAPGIWRRRTYGTAEITVASAGEALTYFA